MALSQEQQWPQTRSSALKLDGEWREIQVAIWINLMQATHCLGLVYRVCYLG